MAAPDSSLHKISERRDFFAGPDQRFSTVLVQLLKGHQMTMRRRLLKRGSPALVAVFAVSICACTLSSDAYAENPKAVPEALRDSAPIQTLAPARQG